MKQKYLFEIDAKRQKNLEERVELILAAVQEAGEGTVEEKNNHDELIVADVAAKQVIFREAPSDVYVITEEGKHGRKSQVVELWDPIDGSSEFNRIGKKRSPVMTAGLVVCENKIIAAAAGDIWNNSIYGLDERGLYIRTTRSEQRTYITISEEKRNLTLEKAFVAAYAPTKERMEIILPLLDVVPYFHNNGGQPFAFRVVEGTSPKSYAAALEAKPVPLWEHIGPFMAEYAGASVSKLDDCPLDLDLEVKQTSITAVNNKIRHGIINALKQNCQIASK